jgi:PKD repeat protein
MKTYLILCIGLALLTACDKKDDQPPIAQTLAPTADFSFPTRSENGVAVQFQNTSQHATKYRWTFGDGASDTAFNPAHTYTAAGTYTVTLRAFAAPDSAIATKSVKVSKYDAFAHANIPVVSTYSTYGKRYTNYFDVGPLTPPSTVTRLRDSLMTVTRLSPDSLRINGFLAVSTKSDPGFPRVLPGNPYVFQVNAPGGDATFLALYVIGDSLQLRQLSHVGHSSSGLIMHGGRRRP